MTNAPGDWVGYAPADSPRTPTFGAPDTDPVALALENILQLVLRFLRQAGLDPGRAALIAPGQISIRTVARARVQAVTVSRGGKNLIVVNRGLAMYLYRLARIFSRHVIVRGPGDPATPSEDESVRLMAPVLDWMASLARAPLISENWEVSDREKRTADNFTTAAERFVICHELAHVLLADSIAELPADSLPHVELESFDTRAMTEELMADRWATRMVLDSMHADRLDVRAAAVGIHYFLEALEAAETVGAITADEAHPPARERLILCDTALEERFGDRSGYVQSWAIELNRLLFRLLGGAYVWRDVGRKMAKARMDRIFAQTRWPVPPVAPDPTVDPVATMEYFLRDSPSGVIDSIAANLLDADAYARLIPAGSQPDTDGNDAWRRHQLACFLARQTPQQVQDALGVYAVGVQA
jgi:hypothetical protein